MIGVYLATLNVILDFTIFKITILVNFTNKALKIDKDICIVTIYECVDIAYFIVGSFGVFAVLIVVSAAISEFLSPV